jgi:SAM-dependent methyltransferase
MKNQYFIELVKRYCPARDIVILEIGCGQGFFAQQCRQNDIAYAAFEANEMMANALAAQGFEVHRGFAPPLSISKQFDVIFMDQVFEHMRGRDEAIEMIETCKAHLKPGGILLICSPDIFTIKEDFFSDYTHNNPTCMPMLDRIFMDCELEIVYRNHVVQFIRGLLTTRVLAFIVRISYALGLFHLAFGKRAHLAKVSLLPSCVIIGRLVTPSSH